MAAARQRASSLAASRALLGGRHGLGKVDRCANRIIVRVQLEAGFRQKPEVAGEHDAISRHFAVGQLDGLPLVFHRGFD